MALAESRRQQGYFKGFGYGEFGFHDAASATEEDSAEGGEQEKQEEPARASYQVKKRGPAAAERPKASDSQKNQEAVEVKKDEEAIFKAFRDFYFKSQKEGAAEGDKKSEQEGMLKASAAVAKFNKEQQQQQENNKGQNVHKAISYAYSTIEHNQYYPKVENKQQDSKKKAEARSSEDDSGYYYYVKRY